MTESRPSSEEPAAGADTEEGEATAPDAEKKTTGPPAAADDSFGGDAALVDEPDPWD